MLDLQEIMNCTHGTLIQGEFEQSIDFVHFDSRKIEPNALFIALPGNQVDGHHFIHAAKQNGAICALISRTDFSFEGLEDISLIRVENTEQALQKLAAYYRQKLTIPIIGITGSNGKTTTKDMVTQLLSAKYQVYKTEGNLNNHLGLPLSLLQIKKHHTAAVLEMGMSQLGEIDFLANIAKPSISIITNIGDSHIEFLGSRDNIAKAKGEILPHTDPEQFILLNKDDPYSSSYLSGLYAGEIYYFSTQSAAHVYASEIQMNEQGTSFQLHLNNQVIQAFIPMYGQHNVANVLPGAYIAYKLGVSLEAIAASLYSLHVSDMRFQLVEGPNEVILINDAYNASPSSMKAAIHTFEQIYPTRKKITVLGDIFELGAESERLHREVGEYLQGKDMTVLTVGDHAAIIAEHAGGTHYADKHDAIQALQPYLNEECAILFKASRGMKLEEMILSIRQEQTK